jgi:hypothetical protein
MTPAESRQNTFRQHRSEPAYVLTEQEAFLALTLFINQVAARARDDLITMLGDVGIESDGGTTDPAAWEDWINCVRVVKSEPTAGNTFLALGAPRI